MRPFIVRTSALTLFSVVMLFGAFGPAAAQPPDCMLGEIRLWPGTVVPLHWMVAEGQLIPLLSNTALFQLIGFTYGGDGRTTYALPDLRGRLPIGVGQGPGLTSRALGEVGGEEAITLTEADMPPHTHPAMATRTLATSRSPAGRVLARTPEDAAVYGPATNQVAMSPNAIGATGGGQPHNNMPPFLGLRYIICTQGFFPATPD